MVVVAAAIMVVCNKNEFIRKPESPRTRSRTNVEVKEGALMVLVLKVISCAINYNDGLLKEEDLREVQKKNRLVKLPSLIEYVGYCLCCGSHFAGPVYEMKDYLDWTERKGIWTHSQKAPSPSPYGATVRSLVQAAFCMGLYLYLVPQFPLSRFTEPIYHEWGFWKRLGYQYMAGFTARWKYYFIWSISEAAIIISGLGFSGWTDSSPPKPRWDRAKNVDILGVELAKTAAQISLVWNIQVSTCQVHFNCMLDVNGCSPCLPIQGHRACPDA
ncbi:Lysophosphatidylcholine acyltransferase 1 [Sarracenia purpurea var. burkii]